MQLFDGLIINRKDIIVFLIGCFATFYINLVGRVYVGELIIFLLYVIKPKTRANLPKELKVFRNLMYLWLASAIVTDIWRHTPLIDMLKGTISIMFLIALVPFVYWALYDRLSRWMVFYLGTVVSSQLTYYLITSQTEFGSAEIWKTYSYSPLFTGLAIYLYWKGKKFWSYVIFLIFGMWILYGGSRNVFIACSMTVLILVVANRYSKYDITNQLKLYQSRILFLLLSMIIGVFAITNTYEYLASNGKLGIEAYEKYNKQKNSEFGMASGRMEVIMDADLISKSPIIGYGSFAKDRNNYVMRFYVKHNIPFLPTTFDRDIDSVENMLPRHSRIGGLWMWHGIGAGIFWIYTLFLILRTLLTGCFLQKPRLSGLCIFTMMQELWDIFFSPMSVRLIFLFMIVYMTLINNRTKLMMRESRC